jgi:hypothetical protein
MAAIFTGYGKAWLVLKELHKSGIEIVPYPGVRIKNREVRRGVGYALAHSRPSNAKRKFPSTLASSAADNEIIC